MIREIRRAVAPSLKRAAMRLGVYAAIRRALPHRGVAILRYHAICEPATCEYASAAICMSPGDFERQVAYLVRNYRVLPLPEVAEAFRTGRALPPNAVVFTFDDGYADNLEAARILARRGATGTFYLTAGCLGGEAPFWVSEVRMLVNAVRDERIVFCATGAPVEVPLPAAGPREAAIRAVTRMMKSNSIPVREALRDELRVAAGHPALPDPMLTWDQVREMARMGMTIGAHTMTHANLPSAGLDAAREELTASKRRLEAEVGEPVTMCSYPNGGADRYFTPELQRLAADVGYACATTSRNGLAGPGSDLFALERVSVAGSLDELVYRLEVDRLGSRPTSAPWVSD
jgi:peptidoglycan/xylan/chitin deacetylase (PgdA/CDA1 family)